MKKKHENSANPLYFSHAETLPAGFYHTVRVVDVRGDSSLYIRLDSDQNPVCNHCGFYDSIKFSDSPQHEHNTTCFAVSDVFG
jgi:hypothetical protein